MRVLITGAAGFVGRHLIEHLLFTDTSAEYHGAVLSGTAPADPGPVIYHALDLRDSSAVQSLIGDVRPDQIYHLAAQASPRRSFVVPWQTLENNLHPQVNLAQACLNLDLRPKTLVVSSAEIYGPIRPDQLPVTEEHPLRPTSPYGVSKAAQDLLGWQYFMSHRLPILRVRPFNHIGPGQSEGFVAVDFAMQIARIEAGQQLPVIEVGNLTAQRDFTDVRDVVRAYRLVMAQGTEGEVYNVASGTARTIQSMLETLISISGTFIEVRVDPARLMPADIPVIRGDASRIRAQTGWVPSIPFEQTLLDVLNDCRTRIAG